MNPLVCHLEDQLFDMVQKLLCNKLMKMNNHLAIYIKINA